jgi:putative ABC transport system substrate-binding protein
MFKKIWSTLLVLSLLLIAGCTPATQAVEPPAPTEALQESPTEAPPEKVVVIGMMTIASHPSLDNIQKGVKDSLAAAGYVDGENLKIIEGNAQGDIATLTTIAQQFLDEKVDLIVATTTPALQAAYNVTKDAQSPPVFFNGVSNPYTAGIAEAPDKHPAWVIGNQLLDPVEDTMELIKELVPDVSTIGLVYNPAEANAVYLVEVVQSVCDEMGITLETASVANSSEIQTAAESLASRDIDAFLAINDNTVTSGFEPLVKVANENKIPLFGTSASMPGLGAAVSYGINPYQEGLDSGEMVVSFLQGKLDIATTPYQIQDAVLLTVNPAAAELQGLELPQELIDKADNVIE